MTPFREQDMFDRFGQSTGKPRHARKSRGLALALVLLPVFGGCSGGGDAASLSIDSTRSASLSGAGDLQIVGELPAFTTSSGQDEQRLSPNDVLEIDVFQVNDLDRTVRIEPNGKVSLPMIGEVVAAGLTIPEFERTLESRYNVNLLQNASISVFMKESAGQRVTMDGEFNKPGLYPVTSQATLLQTVALASGLTKLADEKKVAVFRRYDDRELVAIYSIDAIRKGMRRDPAIHGGDKVVAFTSDFKIAKENLKDALSVASSVTRLVTPF